jgi:hypothetical protein
MEQDSSWRRNIKPLKDLRVEQWQRHHFLQLLNMSAKPSDRVEGHLGRHAEGICIGQSC